MSSILQASLMGVPILYVVHINENPQAFYLILITMIFIICMVTLCSMFVPKMLYTKVYLSKNEQSKANIMKEAIRRSTNRRQKNGTGGDPSSSSQFSTSIVPPSGSLQFPGMNSGSGNSGHGTAGVGQGGIGGGSGGNNHTSLDVGDPTSRNTATSVVSFALDDEHEPSSSTDNLDDNGNDGLKIVRKSVISLVEEDIDGSDNDGEDDKNGVGAEDGATTSKVDDNGVDDRDKST